MKTVLTILGAMLLASACHGPIPEGVYPCRTAADCPSAWVCRDDSLCWIHPLPPDAGADTGRNCVSETCNGRDDDCDQLVDEGLLAVGAAVSADPTSGPPPVYLGGLIVPLSTGFAVFGTSSNSAVSGGWSTIDATGAVRATAPQTRATAFLDARAAGDQVLASGAGHTTPESTNLGLLQYDFATGVASRSFLAIGNASDDLRAPIIADFGGPVARIYELSMDTSGLPSLTRGQVDPTTPSILNETLISDDVDSGFAVLHTSATTYASYRSRNTHDVQLVRDDAGLSSLGVVTAAADPLVQSRLAIRDTERPLSPSNPILLVWVTANGTVSFVEITNATDSASFAASPIRILSGTRGPATSFLLPLPGIAIVPAPYVASSAPPHWLVAILGNNGDSRSIAQVFEITETSIRELDVPDEMYADRVELGLAVSNGAIRLAEAGNSSGLVTRAIGCE